MKLDLYAPCPGGRPQKVKFCCPDLHKDLERLFGVFDSQQWMSIGDELARLEQSHSDCACLDALQIQLLIRQQKWEEAHEKASAFLAREPQNHVALMSWAVSGIPLGKSKEALHAIISTLEQFSVEQTPPQLLVALWQIAQMYVAMNLVPTAMPIFHFLIYLSDDDMVEMATQCFTECLGANQFPLVMRQISPYLCPSDFPAAEEYKAIFMHLQTFRWKQALVGLKMLAVHAPQFPQLLLVTARLQTWLMEMDQAAATLGEYLQLEKVSYEDKVDALIWQRFLLADPLGDRVPISHFVYTLTEDAYPLEVIASSRRVAIMPVEPSQRDEQGVVPLRNFLCLDRARPTEENSTPNFSEVPRILAMATLSGKQTDRPTTLDVFPSLPTNDSAIETLIRELFSTHIIDCLKKSPLDKKSSGENFPSEESLDGTVSFSQLLSQPNLYFAADVDMSPEYRETIVSAYDREVFAETWMTRPLGMLAGKSPQEVMNDAAYRVPLEAATALIRHFIEMPRGKELADLLRERLGLGEEKPLELTDEQLASEQFIMSIPLERWRRLEFERIPNSTLNHIWSFIDMLNDNELLSIASEELLARPMNDFSYEVRARSLDHMMQEAVAERNIEEVFVWIDRARNEAKARGQEDPHWDCVALQIHLACGNQEEVAAIMARLRPHAKHPEVQQLFQQLNEQSQMMRQRQTANPQNAALWTPDQMSPPPTSGGSTLWTPS